MTKQKLKLVNSADSLASESLGTRGVINLNFRFDICIYCLLWYKFPPNLAILSLNLPYNRQYSHTWTFTKTMSRGVREQ